jgi:hypothetical protein
VSGFGHQGGGPGHCGGAPGHWGLGYLVPGQQGLCSRDCAPAGWTTLSNPPCRCRPSPGLKIQLNPPISQVIPPYIALKRSFTSTLRSRIAGRASVNPRAAAVLGAVGRKLVGEVVLFVVQLLGHRRDRANMIL